MLSQPLKLGQVDATKLIDYLYGFFYRDFVIGTTLLNKQIVIDPECHRKDAGKEKSFWHLTTRNNSRQVRQGARYVTLKERLTDYPRSERIEWVKQIIENHSHDRIRYFYHQETDSKQIRLYLWAFQDDFVVILQKLGRNSSSILVTSFFITYDDKRDVYEKRLARFQSGGAPELKGCEWF